MYVFYCIDFLPISHSLRNVGSRNSLFSNFPLETEHDVSVFKIQPFSSTSAVVDVDLHFPAVGRYHPVQEISGR